jgi:ribosomal protein S18 acetylase RimI-like enzyme
MKNGIHINTAGIEDLRYHFGLLNKDFIKQLESRKGLKKYIEKVHTNATLYEFWEDNKLIGIAAVYENRDIKKPAYLTNLSVVEKENGKGIGKKLMDVAIESLKEKEYTELLLEVQKNNDNALRLYRQLGFAIDYENSRNAWLMKLRFSVNTTRDEE